jgi:predicted RNase H-like HicB family nuclease
MSIEVWSDRFFFGYPSKTKSKGSIWHANSMSSSNATRKTTTVTSVPQIPGCHTQARSLDAVTQRIREAIEVCFEVEGAPEQILEFIRLQRITIPE